MDKKCCENCFYYKAKLFCARWPKKFKTRSLFWCGEWKDKVELGEPQMVSVEGKEYEVFVKGVWEND